MRTCMIGLAACAALVVSTANAHGPQIQVTNTGGKIVTRMLSLDGPYSGSLTAPKTVYVLPILQAIGGIPAANYWMVMPNSSIDTITHLSADQFGPGLAYGYGHTFDSGQHFNVNFMDSLKRWDGSTFGNNPNAEEIGAFRGDSTSAADTAFTTDIAPYQGLVFSNISASYGDESHSSMRFRMLGDGISALVEPHDGIYLLKLQITSTQPSLAPSDLVSFVLYKNAASVDLSAAVASLGIDSSLVQFTAIPEPGAVTLAIAGLCGLLSLRRNARCNQRCEQ